MSTAARRTRNSAHPQLGAPLLAAKVYRPRMFRNLKNDAEYRAGGALIGDDGKTLRKKREQRAVAKRSKVGREMLHSSWLGTEHATLKTLREAGADTPNVYAVSGNAILMDYFGDHSTYGRAAAQPGGAGRARGARWPQALKVQLKSATVLFGRNRMYPPAMRGDRRGIPLRVYAGFQYCRL